MTDSRWQQYKAFLGDVLFDSRMRRIEGHGPELWRESFEAYQTSGPSVLSELELEGIKPLLDAQINKEIFLNGLAEECFEWRAKRRFLGIKIAA